MTKAHIISVTQEKSCGYRDPDEEFRTIMTCSLKKRSMRHDVKDPLSSNPTLVRLQWKWAMTRKWAMIRNADCDDKDKSANDMCNRSTRAGVIT